MRPTMAMIIASSQLITVMPKSKFNRNVVYNDNKAEQNTVFCSVLK